MMMNSGFKFDDFDINHLAFLGFFKIDFEDIVGILMYGF